ncbi:MULTISPECIES: 6,7-dimethyl-8-ribityllumazine synthase [Devosia]|uniref:6,7-dimethyl-8-ribityllumazine synthase n=1 Tax=Devosia salina TaxID=2860336 RepID=UPI001F0A8382|nr:6,7-dimethyl-8-ribityllumazine synthase [Devosia salina]
MPARQSLYAQIQEPLRQLCLGCVIKVDTAHFEYISEAAGHGLVQDGLETGTPITFGILTTYTDEQAILRSRMDEHNKGREAAAACLDALHTIAAIAR